jgi:PIN domain nuclease of toxin-antitoxin system
MRVLLDTHVFIWAAADDPRLSERARAILTDSGSELLLSAASAWEIVIKVNAGKLRIPEDPEQFVSKHMSILRIRPLPIQMDHALAVHGLPPVHKDPFDRLLIAQSKWEKIPLLSGDSRIARYDANVIW